MKAKSHNVCIVAHGFYPAPRKYREAMALRDGGYKVDVLCIKWLPTDKSTELYEEVNIFRLPIVKKRSSKFRYILEYSLFFLLASIKLNLLYLRKRYLIIQVHSMPEFLVFTALLPKLFGSKIILDVQDPTREVFIAKYSCKETNIMIKIAELQEKLSFAFADSLITPNLGFKKKFVERGLDGNKMEIIMNTPDERIFKKSHLGNGMAIHKNDNFILLFHGVIMERHGLDIAIKALSNLVCEISNVIFEIAGVGEQLEYNKNLADRLKLNDYVIFHGLVEQKKIPELILRSDIGIIPNRLNPFININLPTRIFEYATYEVPVVIPRTSGVEDYFDENCLAFFRPEDPDDLAQKIAELYFDSQRRKRIASNAKKICEELKWDIMKRRYIKIVDVLYRHECQGL